MTPSYYQCWDYYRINKIVVRFYPTYTTTTAADSSDHPILYGQTVIDLDDATVPTQGTRPPFSGYSSVKTWVSNRTHTRVFRPKANIDMYGSATNTGYAFQPGRNRQWFDSAQKNIPHYGLKYWMYQPGQSISYKFRLCVKAYISLREFHDPGND